MINYINFRFYCGSDHNRMEDDHIFTESDFSGIYEKIGLFNVDTF
jgi:hypothetical protein